MGGVYRLLCADLADSVVRPPERPFFWVVLPEGLPTGALAEAVLPEVVLPEVVLPEPGLSLSLALVAMAEG